jgi:xanthine dehydrogenase accessory factor
MAERYNSAMAELFEQLVDQVSRGGRVALCVVVATRGSTPQQRGAKMLVLSSGCTVGTLGGGCVEAEVRRVTLELMAAGESRLISFSLDHDYGWDDGLICGGVMDVLVTVVTSPEQAAPFAGIADAMATQRGARLELVDPASGRTFVEELGPPPVLVIAGAGHVGQALATTAATLGFVVDVLDDRADFACRERFPSARRFVVAEVEQALRAYPADEQTYIVIVTRGHRHDGQALEAALGSPARYVGLIGSKSKIKQIFDDLHERGVPLDMLLRVHAPIGLDIGAVSVQEIAISIAAELVAVRRGRENVSAPPMKMNARELERWLKRHD